MLVMRATRWVTCPGSVYAAESPIHGRGVFAARQLGAGDTIEECLILKVPGDQASLLEETDLFGFTFEWEDGVAVALGFGSLYNHSWTPNARYDHDYDRDLVIYSAVRAIAAGEEITVNYSGDPDGHTDLWFDAEPDPS
jgi:SET domain-containing protein